MHPSDDLMDEALLRCQQLEEQRLRREEQYALAQARKQRESPDYPEMVRAIRTRYARLRREVRVNYRAMHRALAPEGRTRRTPCDRDVK